MSLQLLNEINNNYHMALAVHREIADCCWAISLPGYALWHEFNFLSESMTQRKIKRYMTETYHTFMPEKLPTTANIIQPLLGNKNRKTLKPDETWSILKELFRIYCEWEESTLSMYQQISIKILDNGEVSTFNFVGEIIKDVKNEFVYLNDKTIELNAHNWDMPQIVAEQPAFYERFEYLIKQLHGKSEKYHYWNSARDPQSRMFF